MKKEAIRSTLLPLVIITAGGILALGICYLLFLLINNLGESMFFSTNIQSAPVFTIRRVFAVVLLVLYIALLRTKVSELVKATILVGPLGFLTTLRFSLSIKSQPGQLWSQLLLRLSALFWYSKVRSPGFTTMPSRSLFWFPSP